MEQPISPEVTFGPGPLGITVIPSKDGTPIVRSFTNTPDGKPGQAERMGVISLGDSLVFVNEEDVRGQKYDYALSLIRASPRPITMRFQARPLSQPLTVRLQNTLRSLTPPITAVPSTTKDSTADAEGSSPVTPPPSRTELFQRAVEGGTIQLEVIRSLSFSGIPEETGLRPTYWKILLDVLPSDTRQWKSVLEDKRALYAGFKHDLIQRSRLKNKLTAAIEAAAAAEVEAKMVAVATGGTEAAVEATESEAEEAMVDLLVMDDVVLVSDAASFPNPDTEVVLISPCLSPQASQRVTVTEDPLTCPDSGLWAPQRAAVSQDLMSSADDALIEEIEKDVRRTHPGLSFFNQETGDALERILFLYAKLNPGIRYVQGMNELVAPLYYVLAKDPAISREDAEADTFYCFNTIMGDIKDLFIVNLDSTHSGIEGSMELLSAMLSRHDPELNHHLHNMGLDPQFYALRWFTTLLSREFCLPDTIQLWDSLLADPDRFDFLLYVCTSMLMLQRPQLLAGDFSFCIKMLQDYPPTDLAILLDRANLLRNRELTLRNQQNVASAFAMPVPNFDAVGSNLSAASAALSESVSSVATRLSSVLFSEADGAEESKASPRDHPMGTQAGERRMSPKMAMLKASTSDMRNQLRRASLKALGKSDFIKEEQRSPSPVSSAEDSPSMSLSDQLSW